MKIKTVIKVSLFLIIGIVLQFIGGKILKCDVNSFARITIHELHATPDIQTLFIGDSHTYCGINPAILDKGLNENTLVAATSCQTIDGSYALLREAFYYHPEIKTVYLDFDYFHNDKFDFKERNHLPQIYAISTNLKNQKVKFDYLIHATSPKYWLNSYLVFGKNKVSPKPGAIINTVKAYLNGSYWKYNYPVEENEEYLGKGYIPFKSSCSENCVFNVEEQLDFVEEEVSKDFIKTLEQIIKFCQDNKIELNVISIPETDFCIKSHTNYDNFHNYIASKLNNTGFNFYDFNLLKTEYFSFNTKYFSDTDHLSLEGATVFCNFLIDFINNGKDTSKYFYTSITEKQELLKNNVLGFIFDSSEEGFSFKPVACLTEDSNLTYKICFYENNNLTQAIENTSNTEVMYPKSTVGKVVVNYFINEVEAGSFEKSFNTKWIN